MRKLKILVAAFLAISLSLFLLAGFLRGKYAVPILMYHHVMESGRKDKLIVSPAAFERQMRFLRENRYNVLPLEKVAGLIRDKKKLPPKTVAITFDDGNVDNYIHAFPVLKEYNLPATLFIIVQEVGRPQGDKLSWEQIEIMRDSGLIDFGSHCVGPDPLIKLKDDEVRRQIFDSKRMLEEKTGKEVSSFSYPEGMFNARIKQLVIEAGYKSAVATKLGNAEPNDDVFALKRIRVSPTSGNPFVFWLELSGYYNFMKEHRKK